MPHEGVTAVASDVLTRAAKKRVQWVQKRLKNPGEHRDVLYEVLTRKEGKAFLVDVTSVEAARVYAAVLLAVDVFTSRQRRLLQADGFPLRVLAASAASRAPSKSRRKSSRSRGSRRRSPEEAASARVKASRASGSPLSRRGKSSDRRGADDESGHKKRTPSRRRSRSRDPRKRRSPERKRGRRSPSDRPPKDSERGRPLADRRSDKARQRSPSEREKKRDAKRRRSPSRTPKRRDKHRETAKACGKRRSSSAKRRSSSRRKRRSPSVKLRSPSAKRRSESKKRNSPSAKRSSPSSKRLSGTSGRKKRAASVVRRKSLKKLAQTEGAPPRSKRTQKSSKKSKGVTVAARKAKDSGLARAELQVLMEKAVGDTQSSSERRKSAAKGRTAQGRSPAKAREAALVLVKDVATRAASPGALSLGALSTETLLPPGAHAAPSELPGDVTPCGSISETDSLDDASEATLLESPGCESVPLTTASASAPADARTSEARPNVTVSPNKRKRQQPSITPSPCPSPPASRTTDTQPPQKVLGGALPASKAGPPEQDPILGAATDSWEDLLDQKRKEVLRLQLDAKQEELEKLRDKLLKRQLPRATPAAMPGMTVARAVARPSKPSAPTRSLSAFGTLAIQRLSNAKTAMAGRLNAQGRGPSWNPRGRTAPNSGTPASRERKATQGPELQGALQLAKDLHAERLREHRKQLQEMIEKRGLSDQVHSDTFSLKAENSAGSYSSQGADPTTGVYDSPSSQFPPLPPLHPLPGESPPQLHPHLQPQPHKLLESYREPSPQRQADVFPPQLQNLRLPHTRQQHSSSSKTHDVLQSPEPSQQQKQRQNGETKVLEIVSSEEEGG